MNSLAVVAIDDEHLALDLVQKYVEQCPGLQLTGRFQLPVAALEHIRQQPPDVLLLDIQMPGLSGLNLLRSLPRPPVTIFTTAYQDYALDAFELDVVDYLLKPFPYERFLRAIGKARERLPAATATSPVAPPPATLNLRVDGKRVKIAVADILFVEGLREYVRIHTAGERYVTLERLHQLEDQLPSDRFLRVHKSYLVAIDKVRSLAGNQLEIGPHRIPVSRSRREAVTQRIFGG